VIHRLLTAALLVTVACAAGCATMGTGSGSTASGTRPVTFKWKSSDDVSGSITATLARGKTYAGKYFQVTRETDVSDLGPPISPRPVAATCAADSSSPTRTRGWLGVVRANVSSRTVSASTRSSPMPDEGHPELIEKRDGRHCPVRA
jgi:hypothetical protein